MKQTVLKTLILIALTTFFAFTCQEKDNSPVEPPTHGTISGVVIDANNESEIVNASIYTEPATDFVSTNSQGYYIIKTVEPAAYKVYCFKDGYDTVNVGVTVIAGAISTADFQLNVRDTSSASKFGKVEGFIRNLFNEQPLQNVLLTTEPISGNVLTDATGKYTFNKLIPGQYKITAMKKDFDTVAVSVKVIKGQTTTAHFYLKPQNMLDSSKLGSVYGKIIDFTTASAIGNVLISTKPTTIPVLSDNAGNYKLKALKAGEYFIYAFKNNYLKDSLKITVQPGINSQADFILKPATASFEGIVKNSSNTLLQGVFIKSIPDIGSKYTNSNGYFKFDRITPGQYKFITNFAGYLPDTSVINFEGGDKINYEIILQAK